jgi:hypothetical protein
MALPYCIGKLMNVFGSKLELLVLNMDGSPVRVVITDIQLCVCTRINDQEK